MMKNLFHRRDEMVNRGSLILIMMSALLSCATALGAESPHVVFVVGTHHYDAHRTLPKFAKYLESQHDWRTTVVSTDDDPEQNDKGLPGLDALEDADVAVFFMRFLTLPGDQLKTILSYVRSGRPVVGLRTSTHAFLYPQDHPLAGWNDGFGKRVLGTRYYAHMSGETQVRPAAGAEGHPILDGVDSRLTVPSPLYVVKLPAKAKPLLKGTGRRERGGIVENRFGTHRLQKVETDPVAWTWENEWGGDVFASTLGGPGDMKQDAVRLLLTNGIRWVLEGPEETSPARESTRTTHRFDRGDLGKEAPLLFLSIRDRETGEPTPARFTLRVDGEPWVPPAVGRNGLRFVSRHEGKDQSSVVTYSRGSGPVTVELPEGAERVAVRVAKGLTYLPVREDGRVSDGRVSLSVDLRQWSDITADGWHAGDEHLHYNRIHPAADRRWLTMLAADDLAYGHFLVLSGGNGGAGIWATQHTYGETGRRGNGDRLLVPGEEHRDRAQGHINLLGLKEVIEPISTGGLGPAAPAVHHPPFFKVMREARAQGGLAGVAHGAMLGSHPTAVADTIRGAVDFWEISNGFNRKTDLWYHLMSCGFVHPPAAGTDLPNYPRRDPWQPFLGSVRTYVRVGDDRTFGAWKRAFRHGKVFTTSGPILRFTVNGVGPGGTVKLPPDGGTVHVRAELTSPRELQALDIVRDGTAIDATPDMSKDGPIRTWRIDRKIEVDESTWVAARGTGAPIESLDIDAKAHTAAVRILVGEEPIQSAGAAAKLVNHLQRIRSFYQEHGRYPTKAARKRALDAFDEAIARLQEQTP